MRGAWRADVTGTGWVVAVLGLLALILGTVMHWTELLILAGTALALVVLALLVVRVPLGARHTLRVRPLRTRVGGTVRGELVVHAGRMPLIAPEVVVPVGPDRARLRLPILAANREHVEPIRIAAERRGVHVVGPVAQVRTDVLGLARREVPCTGAVEVFVRPRTVPLDSLAPGVVNDLEGVPSDQLSVSDLAFHALREYVPGDDLRHVHWRSSARAGSLLVRQYQETRRSSALVFVDTHAAAYASRGDLELALSAAASVMQRALTDDFEVAFAWDAECVNSDASHPDPLLDATCRVEAAKRPRDPLRHDVGRAATAVPGASLVVILSGGARPAAELSVAANSFGRDALRVVIRADASGTSALAEQSGIRLLTLSRLEHLPLLLLRGSR